MSNTTPGSIAKVMAATALYGAVHSALASSGAKNAAARRFGLRNRNGLYRCFYLVQSVGTFALLGVYIHRQPAREIYRAPSPLCWLMHAGQLGGLVWAVVAAKQVGFSRILGLKSLSGWIGPGMPPAEPEAQGPALDAEGLSRAPGPFAFSRHPLNLAPLPVCWFWPRMNTNLLAFNTVATAYLVLGSMHEEKRLREAYGTLYERYQSSGTPFYFPGIDPGLFPRESDIKRY